MSKLLKVVLPSITAVRNAGRKTFKWEGGIQYPGFKYYPRFPDFKDPPYEPSKLFRVKRIKSLKGVPHFHLEILKSLGLLTRMRDVAIVKNIPENNHRLWKIKHLIEIQPITFPNGFPTDNKGTYLKENGELVITKKVDEETRLQLREEVDKSPKKLDGDTLRRDTRQKWMTAWDFKF